MLSRVKRTVLALLTLTFLVTGCDDDKKSATKKAKGPAPPIHT